MSQDRLDLYFDILDLVKSGTTGSSTLENKLENISLSEKQKVISFFESIIDQPAFMTNDYKRIRSFLIDWYASQRTLVSHAKNSKNPYNLSSEELHEHILGFGFPYPDKIVSTNRKAQFILEAVNLYKNKGTPETFVKSLQSYFGLSDIIVSEWWIRQKPSGVFVAKSQPIYPAVMRNRKDLIVEHGYSEFVDSDNLWRLTEEQLANYVETSAINLPSLTPYISLQVAVNLTELNVALHVLSRKLQESFQYWTETGELYRNISLNNFEGVYCLLEICLGIIYLFDGGSEDNNDKRFLFYQGATSPFDKPDPVTGERDDIDDVDFQIIIDEYNNVSQRPKSRVEHDENLLNRKSNFNSINDGTANVIVDVLENPGGFLELINPEFKALLDTDLSDTDTVLRSLLGDLEYHLREEMSLSGIPLDLIILGVPIFDKFKKIFDLFKPYRSRIKDLITSFKIDDPLGDSQLEKDEYSIFIDQVMSDWGNFAFADLDHSFVIDKLKITLSETIGKDSVSLFCKDDILTSIGNTELDLFEPSDLHKNTMVNQYIQEIGPHGLDNEIVSDRLRDFILYQNLKSKMKFLRTDEILNVSQYNKDIFNPSENLNILTNQFSREKGNFGFENGLIKDSCREPIITQIPKSYLDKMKIIDFSYISNKETDIFNSNDVLINSINQDFKEHGAYLDGGLFNDKLVSTLQEFFQTSYKLSEDILFIMSEQIKQTVQVNENLVTNVDQVHEEKGENYWNDMGLSYDKETLLVNEVSTERINSESDNTYMITEVTEETEIVDEQLSLWLEQIFIVNNTDNQDSMFVKENLVTTITSNFSEKLGSDGPFDSAKIEDGFNVEIIDV